MAPAEARYYRPELDLLRLLAFLMVWLAHALIPFATCFPEQLLRTAEGAGSCGVPVFFFLSAFLITELLRRERANTGTVHLPSFYVRRILRIWPLYLGILLIYGLLGLRWHGFRIENGRLAASLVLAGNWYIAFHPAITSPMRALWSVSVEEQWYLVWPWCRRRFSDRQLLAGCLLAVVAAQLLLSMLASRASGAMLEVTAWVNSGVQFQYFALGAAAALLLDGRVLQFRSYQRVLLCLLGCGTILAASALCRMRQPGIAHSASSLIAGYLLTGLGTISLFLSFFGLSAARCPRALVRLGQLSFGLYVFHETGFFLANAAVRRAGLPAGFGTLVEEKLLALALAVLLAFVSYHIWELPFLRLKERWTFVRTREAQ